VLVEALFNERKRGNGKYRGYVFLSGLPAGNCAELITIHEQPQMKKYRYLWSVSTINHYILYFVHIPRPHIPESGLLPVESSNHLGGRGFQRSLLPQLQCNRVLARPLSPFPSLALAATRNKAQKWRF
jgi:hypothetical protein